MTLVPSFTNKQKKNCIYLQNFLDHPLLDIISFTVNGTEDKKLALEAFLKIEIAAIFGRWRRRCKALHL